LAKEVNKKSVPTVTSLPLPSSDSVLVIDLPDGQKLLVGKMDSGSVIEVATWRGTGRPDSRTNRLMLGMSNGDNAVTGEEATDDSSNSLNKFSPQYYLQKIQNLFELSKPRLQKLTSDIRSIRWRKSGHQVSKNSDFDVEEWLKKIKLSANIKSEKDQFKSSGSKKLVSSAGNSVKVRKKSQKARSKRP
jgi:hypothetical protein